MATQNRHPCLGDFGRTTLNHPLEHLERQRVAWEIHDVQHEQRRCAHGVDVAERVSRGDAAPEVGVVDDGRDVVDRGNQCQVGIQLIDGSIVRERRADERTRIQNWG